MSTGYSSADVHELIPIGQRSNFNGKIAVRAGFVCDEEDERSLRAFARGLGIRLTQSVGTFIIERSWEFKASAVLQGQPRSIWTINLLGRKGAERKDRRILSSSEDWKQLVGHLKERLPEILYFQNFLFEIPPRIFLEPGEGSDEETQAFYRDVLQDVLDAMGDGLTLDEHILARAKSGTAPDQKSLESVLLHMGAHITKTVFDRWNRIFNRVTAGKEIQVKLGRTQAQNWYLELKLRDGNSLYEIRERSLGFRWFFAFLLLTQYRGERDSEPQGALFLFDEPASNLHPSAQGQLLDSFGKFPSHSPIVYTTHSHHMVNPDWLEGTFVVRNEALQYTSADVDYSDRETVVSLERYRAFAAKHPNQTTYFQPVLDVLDFQPARLENVPDVVMVEGKTDYYCLRYMQRLLGVEEPKYLVPGTGAGSLEAVMRLYLGWGRDFVALLDADDEGERQRKRYRDMFGGIVEGRLLLLSDINEEWSGKGTEYLFEDADRNGIVAERYLGEAKYKKDLFNRAIQELLMTNTTVRVSDAAMGRFHDVFVTLAAALHPETSAGSA